MDVRTSETNWRVRSVNTHIGIAFVMVGLIGVGFQSAEVCAQPASLGGLPASRLPTQAMGTARLPHDALSAASSVDASLNAISLVSEDHLCAVGDRGVILTTMDAGRKWKAVPSPTTCNLHAVDFVGEKGIAVGGWIGNVTSTSHGVVLISEDGGKNWTELPTLQLARLTGLRIVGNRVIAWGDFSPELNASVFESTDGGRSWRGLPLEIGHAAATAVSHGGTVGAVDTLGRSAFTHDASIRSIPTAQSPVRDMIHTGQRWLACGDGGLLISSANGKDWIPVELPLSSAARAVMRFDSLEVVSPLNSSNGTASRTVANQLWLVGSPGSVVLHSNDGGSSWQTRFTNQPLPLRDATFLDEHRGWAVGVGGVILATRDGGESWYAQRHTASRVGLLSVVNHHALVPWCPLAAAAWDEQVAAVSIVTRPEDALASADFIPTRQALLESLAPKIGLVEQRTWQHANQSADDQARHLAIELLSWRPDVVLTNERPSLGAFVQKRPAVPVSQAVALAADARQAMPFVQELGLANWQVGKIATVTESQNSQYSEQSRRVLRTPGLAIWDILVPLPPDVRTEAESVSMRTLWAQSQATIVHASLLGGSAKSAENSRDLSIGAIGNYQLVMGRVHRDKSLETLVERHAEAGERWKNDLNFVLNSFPASEAPPAMIDLVKRLAENGDQDRLRTALEVLALRAAGTDAADWAKITLLRLSSSDEFAAGQAYMPFQLLRDRSEFSREPKPLPSGSAQINQAIWNATPFDVKADSETPRLLDQQPMAPAVVTAAATETLASAQSSLGSRRSGDWFALLEQAFATSPALHARADMQLLLAHNLQASQNEPGQIQKLQSLEKQRLLIGWHLCARQELLLAANQVDKLKWLAFASRASAPPVLDGVLDEKFWQSAPPIALGDFSGSSTARRTQIAWSYDDRYLYIGIECMRDASHQPKPQVTNRMYDAPLDNRDHVQLVLDTDRDYNTAIELAVAEDGQTYDRCCGIVDYNPKWHVFVNAEQDRWTAEVAIELDALTTQTSLGGAAWAMSARRSTPDQEPLSWSQLRTHRPLLQSSGLILFSPVE